MSIAVSRTESILISTFYQCHCDAFDSGISEHWMVQTWSDKISGTKAVAISYAWGEFDRTEHKIGHYAEHPEAPVSLILGAEWSVTALLNQLVSLTQQGGCWIDQICVPQKDHEIRKTLAAIPQIFNTLPVFVILPGPKCTCLRDTFSTWKQAYIAKQKAHARSADSQGPNIKSKSDHLSKAFMKKLNISRVDDVAADVQKADKAFESAGNELYAAFGGHRCLTSLGACSWPDRVWTLQELRYATEITIVYADKTEIPCLKVSARRTNKNELQNLSGYLGCAYRASRATGFLHPNAAEELVKLNQSFYKKMIKMRPYGLLYGTMKEQDMMTNTKTTGGDLVRERYVRRLLGETAFPIPIDFKIPSDTISDGCDEMRHTPFSATQLKDYILSVFPSLVAYKIPPNTSAYSVIELMADALEQLRKLKPGVFEYFFPNCWPSGLFGAPAGTAHWNLNFYHPKDLITNSRDLYGAFLWRSIVRFSAEKFGVKIPIHILRDSDGKWLMDYADVFPADLSSEEALRALTKIVRYVEPKMEYEEKTDDEDFSPFPWDNSDLENSVFEYACGMAYLNPAICRERNVQLMFRMQDIKLEEGAETNFQKDQCITRIGLVNRSRLEEAKREFKSTMSVSTFDDGRFDSFYEVVESDENKGEFIVIGFWLPLGLEFFCQNPEAIFADKKKYPYNAVIV